MPPTLCMKPWFLSGGKGVSGRHRIGVLMAHTWWLLSRRLRHCSTTQQYKGKLCEAWKSWVVVAQWLEHWWLKPEALGSIPWRPIFFTHFIVVLSPPWNETVFNIHIVILLGFLFSIATCSWNVVILMFTLCVCVCVRVCVERGGGGLAWANYASISMIITSVPKH